jgi:hypothetical protein
MLFIQFFGARIQFYLSNVLSSVLTVSVNNFSLQFFHIQMIFSFADFKKLIENEVMHPCPVSHYNALGCNLFVIDIYQIIVYCKLEAFKTFPTSQYL